MRAAPAQAIVTHGVVDVAALDATTTDAGGDEYMWVGASGVKAEVATVDELANREAGIRVDRNSVQVSRCAPALETEQSCAMRWEVASVEEFSGRALSSCKWMEHAAWTCRVTVLTVTGLSAGSGCRATGSAGCRDGLLWKRERHRDAQNEGQDAPREVVSTK
jgi:hypothetical protein